jgi:hypothetical protein
MKLSWLTIDCTCSGAHVFSESRLQPLSVEAALGVHRDVHAAPPVPPRHVKLRRTRTLNISNKNGYTDTHCDWRGCSSASTGRRAIHRSSRYPEQCWSARRVSCSCLSPFSPGSSVPSLVSSAPHDSERHPVWSNLAPGQMPASWAPQPALVRRKASSRHWHHAAYVCCRSHHSTNAQCRW